MLIFNSFNHALEGIKHAYRGERNFRIELFFAFAAFIAALFFGLSSIEFSLVVIVSVLVLVLEIINSALERFLDVVEARMKPYVKIMKDLLAGAVLIASAGAIIVGFFVFMPHLLVFLRIYHF